VVTPKPDPSLPAGSTCFASDEKICQADACTVVTLSGDQDVCIDGSASFTATPSGVGTWSSGNVGIAEIDANGLITPKGKGKVTMTYTLTSAVAGCPDKFPRDITVQPLPLVNAGPDRRVELGSSVLLNGSTDAISPTILWSPPVKLSSVSVMKPSASPDETTEYTLEITSNKGCTSIDKVNVVVIRPVQVPNIFSPNGDGFNDRWIIFNIEDYPNALVQIFNRYGSKVFEQKGYSISNAWDGTNKGTPYPVGAYYYVINLGDGKKPLAGVVSIVR
jgi:gliding motility-associated-like protein